MADADILDFWNVGNAERGETKKSLKNQSSPAAYPLGIDLALGKPAAATDRVPTKARRQPMIDSPARHF
jgi:hypothetical protein